MQLDLLPTRLNGAAENMATDFLLLQRYPQPHHARFRHYGWHRPAFTFGYSQKIALIRQQLPSDEPGELCRRPSGGGLVDHREDWTYALIIPREHPAYDARAIESYRAIHLCLATSLQAQGVPAALKERPDNPTEKNDQTASICFDHAELHDVVHAQIGQKIAGAAQKRNKHGLLFQGSIARGRVSAAVDWEIFHTDFAQGLATALALSGEEAPWPDWENDELSQLVDHYSAPEWNEFR